MPRSTQCCDIVLCRDTTYCGCCLPKSTGDAKRLKWAGIFVLVLAIIFLLLAFFLPSTINNAFTSALESSAVLSKDGVAMLTFKDNKDSPMKLEVYLYEVTNSHEVLDNGAQPNLVEQGPYVYWVYRTAFNESFKEQNTLLDYKMYERYIFDPELSIADDQTTYITQPNTPVLGVAHGLIGMGMGALLNGFMWGNDFIPATYTNEYDAAFTNRTIREVLFGYPDDPLFNVIGTFLPDLFGTVYEGIINNYTSIQDANERLPFHDQVQTGVGDRNAARQMRRYRGSDIIATLDSNPDFIKCPWSLQNSFVDACKVGGIDGGAIKPIKTKNYPYMNATDLKTEMWFASLFRRANLTFSEKYTEHGNIDLYRFKFDPTMYQSAEENSDMGIFQHKYHGVFNLAAPLGGSPVSVTLPRSLGVTDKKWHETTKITHLPYPEELRDADEDELIDKMEVHVDFERRTGAALRVQATSEMLIDIGPITFEFEEDTDFVMLALSELHEESRAREQNNNNNNNQLSTLENEDNNFEVIDTYRPRRGCGGYAPLSGNGVLSGTSTSCIGSLEQLRQKLQNKMADIKSRQSTTTQQQQQQKFTPQGTRQVTYFPNMTFAPAMHMPLFWANQTAGIGDSDLSALSSTYRAVDRTINVLPIVFLIIAVVLSLFGLFMFLRAGKYQHIIHTQGSVLHESRTAGDLPDNLFTPNPYGETGKEYANKIDYDATLDALDLDNQYDAAGRKLHTSTQSTLHTSNTSRHGHMPNRSVSHMSTAGSMKPPRGLASQGKQQTNYGGVEL